MVTRERGIFEPRLIFTGRSRRSGSGSGRGHRSAGGIADQCRVTHLNLGQKALVVKESDPGDLMR